MSMTTVTTTGSACCGGRGCSETGCVDGGPAEPSVDRFDGFQFGEGGKAQVDPVAGHLGDGSEGAVRLGSPAEVAAAIPHFFGFHPDSSIVVLGLNRSQDDGRAAISHGLRVDLTSATNSPAAFGRWVAGRLADTGVNETLCVIYPPEGGPARMADYRRVVAGMCTPLRVGGVAPLDVLFVADGRWWSFLCDRPACCPAEGSPVNAGASAIAALSAYSGLAVLPNRAALAAGLEPYGPDMVERMRSACDAALNRIAAEHAALHLRLHPELEIELEPELKSGHTFGINGTMEEDHTHSHSYAALPSAEESSAFLDAPLGAHRGVCDELDTHHGLAAACSTPTAPLFSDLERSKIIGTLALPAQRVATAGGECQCGATEEGMTSDIVLAQPGWPLSDPEDLDLDWADVARAWQLADGLCDGQVPPDRALNDEVAGELLIGLVDVRVRDYLATWCGDDRAGQAVALSVELARRAVTADQAAAAFSIAAWAAWALGWGAWSRLCLERASNAVPGYPLATLIKQGLERGVGPGLVREAARGTARRLNEMRADHAATVGREPARVRKAL
jgi:hypothetical protein